MNLDKHSLLLYAVTDRSWLKGQTLAQQVEQALLGGATMVQLREKQLDLPHFRREALDIQALCRRYGAPFLINDNVDLALEIGADGVHVGQEVRPLPGGGPAGPGRRGRLSGSGSRVPHGDQDRRVHPVL